MLWLIKCAEMLRDDVPARRLNILSESSDVNLAKQKGDLLFQGNRIDMELDFMVGYTGEMLHAVADNRDAGLWNPLVAIGRCLPDWQG